MNPFAWTSPRTVIDAAAALDGMTVAKAGGIDLLGLMKERLLAPKALVNLREIPGLDQIEEGEGGALRIGAMATLATIANDPKIRSRYPALADALGNAASPQIRNVATLGGNLLQRPRCWYFRNEAFHCRKKGGEHCFALHGEHRYHAIFDNVLCAIVHPSTSGTVLVALHANVELTDAAGEVRRVALEQFFVSSLMDPHRENDLRPNEILTAIVLPSCGPTTRMAHLKVGEKDSFDWPLADVAAIIDIAGDGRCTNASIVLGAAAPVPYRSGHAERLLLGRRIDDSLARDAGRAAVAEATPLENNAYKVPLFEAVVARTILKAIS